MQTSASDVLDRILDRDSFQNWDKPVESRPQRPDGARHLEAQYDADEAVVTGQGTVDNLPVAVIVSEFGFLAGSIGQVAARRIVGAFERASETGLPMFAATASGGTRMQEGTPAFVEMVPIVEAVEKLKSKRLPYVVYARNPTTGGVLATWASLGHLTYGQPEALVGFLGPSVYQMIRGEAFPTGVQTSENLVEQGILDEVADLSLMRKRLATLLAIHHSRADATPRARLLNTPPTKKSVAPDAWDAVLHTREENRMGARDFIANGMTQTLVMDGTGAGEVANATVVALGKIDGVSCVMVGQDRLPQLRGVVPGPGDFRLARRGIRLSRELGLPLVTLIDTPGAELSAEAEEGALAGEIARTIADLISLTTPKVSVILGQGCGGGAIALLPADRVIALDDSWLSPLPLEGASAIVYRTPLRAQEMARSLHIRASDLARAGTVDVVLANDNTAVSVKARTLSDAVGHELRYLMGRQW